MHTTKQTCFMQYYDLQSDNHDEPRRTRDAPYSARGSDFNVISDIAMSPTVLYCAGILRNATLSNNITMSLGGKPPSPDFLRFVNEHYREFLKDCILYLHIYGFVPFVIRRTQCRNKIPVVLPHGAFTWQVRPATEAPPKGVHYNAAHIARYTITVHNDYRPLCKTLYVFQREPPLLTTKHSPVTTHIAHIVQLYKQMMDAQHRAAQMDAWNTAAHIATTYKPSPQAMAVDPDRSLMDFVHPELASVLAPPNFSARSNAIRAHVHAEEVDHAPNVYTLPVDHNIEQLRPLQHTPMAVDLYQQMRTAVSQTFNIPAFMMDTSPSASRHFDGASSKVQGSSSTTKTTCRSFFLTVKGVCNSLQNAAQFAYHACYGEQSTPAVFTLHPEHWLHIECIDDLLRLHEASLLDEASTHRLANTLLQQATHSTHTQNNRQ